MKLVIVTALVVLGVAAGAQAATRGGAHVAVRTSQYGKVLFTSGYPADTVLRKDSGYQGYP